MIDGEITTATLKLKKIL